MNTIIQFLKTKVLLAIFLLPLFCNVCIAEHAKEKPIVVMIASYQNKKLYKKNLNSVISQNYGNYHVIYIDDCSPDGTGNYVEKYIQDNHLENLITLVKNPTRVGALANDYNTVHSCKDDVIIVMLDGDDWFAHNNVLKGVNEAYSSPKEVWVTHGKYINWPSGEIDSRSKPFSPEIIKNHKFRDTNCMMPLRTFYAWLFKKIKIEDLTTADGVFFPRARDCAIMYPLIEMAGERHAFIDDVNYVYNTINPISDHRVDAQEQINIGDYVRYTLKPYKRLENRDDIAQYVE